MRHPFTGALIQGSEGGIRMTVRRRPLWQRIGIKLGIYDHKKADAKKWAKRVRAEMVKELKLKGYLNKEGE